MLDTSNSNYLEIFANDSAGQKPEGAITRFALRTSNVDAASERARAAVAKSRLSLSVLTFQTNLDRPRSGLPSSINPMARSSSSSTTMLYRTGKVRFDFATVAFVSPFSPCWAGEGVGLWLPCLLQ